MLQVQIYLWKLELLDRRLAVQPCNTNEACILAELISCHVSDQFSKRLSIIAQQSDVSTHPIAKNCIGNLHDDDPI